jgi:hypothetical protein
MTVDFRLWEFLTVIALVLSVIALVLVLTD